MNKKIIIIGTLAIAAACTSLFLNTAKPKQSLVTINKFADHPALKAALEGVKEGIDSDRLFVDLHPCRAC